MYLWVKMQVFFLIVGIPFLFRYLGLSGSRKIEKKIGNSSGRDVEYWLTQTKSTAVYPTRERILTKDCLDNLLLQTVP